MLHVNIQSNEEWFSCTTDSLWLVEEIVAKTAKQLINKKIEQMKTKQQLYNQKNSVEDDWAPVIRTIDGASDALRWQ